MILIVCDDPAERKTLDVALFGMRYFGDNRKFLNLLDMGMIRIETKGEEE